MKKPLESDYNSYSAYTRALEMYCDSLAQPGYRAVKTYHEVSPVYVAQPVQELVGYEHHEYRPFGAPREIRMHAILTSQYMLPDGSVAGDFQWLVDQYKADKNTIKLQPLYTTPPNRLWVGLTKDERLELYRQFEDCLESDDWEYEKAIEDKLKEKNHENLHQMR